MKNTINIFSETGCVTHDMLWKYRQGKLSATEKHAVEVHLTDCELCSDALAGMMIMQTDEVIEGLRKSVRNISAPKKIIRFYDYRILSAAAAVAGLVIVFNYVINSSDKESKKEIAQVIVPQEPKKNEPSPVADLDEQTLKTADTLPAQKQSGNSGKNADNNIIYNNLAISANAIHTPALPTQEGFTGFTSDADKRAEPAAEKATTIQMGDATVSDPESYGIIAPAQADDGMSRAEEKTSAPVYRKNDSETKSKKSELFHYNAAPVAGTGDNVKYRSAETKDKNAESSKITYINDLKVARTPAMSETEKLDTITGTPAMYENPAEKTASEPPAREMPFVYSKTLRDGMNYFHNKLYEEASQTFSIILERFPDDVNSLFYKGLSEMELQNYSHSSTLLNKAMLNSNKTFYEEAKFKLALCYVALNQKGKAEKLLREITKEKGFYSEKASEELQRLR